jgi:hypothetical protein
MLWYSRCGCSNIVVGMLQQRREDALTTVPRRDVSQQSSHQASVTYIVARELRLASDVSQHE